MNEQSPRRNVGATLGALVVALPILTWSFPAIAEPAAAEPAVAEPAAEPAVAEPAVAEPADAEAAAALPVAEPVAEPTVAAPVAAVPAVVEPAASGPVAAMPASIAPTAAMPDTLGMTRRATAETIPRIGAMADVGVPDGASVSIVYRPIRMVRTYAGVSHNMISLGERVGVTITPSWWASPTLTVEYGHYAEGNANPVVRMATGDDTFSSAVLERIGYDYANARVGLELGRKWFTFYLHAGISRITGQVHNLSAEAMSESTGTTTISFPHDPNVRLWTPSVSLGFVVYLAK